MITRKDYMNARPATREEATALHRAYYGEIVQASPGLALTIPVQRVQQALAEGDDNLNTIALHVWDSMAIMQRHIYSAALKERGDGYSLGNGVCVMKEFARQFAKHYGT